MAEARQVEPMRRRVPPSGNGRASSEHGDGPRGRGLLLRRAQRNRFDAAPESNGFRLRRARRVCAPFSAIPDLSRNGS